MVPADVADCAQVEAAADRIEREWGPIDVWINNAMATIFCPAVEIAAEDFRRATEVTHLGAVGGTLAALRRMARRDRGTIVQVGSALAYRSIPLQAPYCGAKSALRGFTDSLRTELIHSHSHVRLAMVQLPVNTPQFDWARNCTGKRAKPLGKIFAPEVAADAIFDAAMNPRREVWVGFPAVQAILGTRIAPGLLDRWLAFRAYEGQHTEEPLPAGYRDNLHEPVREDRGASGRFDDQAKRRSAQGLLNRHRGALFAAAFIALAALGLWLAAS